MNEIQVQRWAKTRQMGKNRYIINFGLLGWGLSLTVVTSILELITQNVIDPFYVIIRFVVFGIFGIAIAGNRWSVQERRYHEQSQTSGGKKDAHQN